MRSSCDALNALSTGRKSQAEGYVHCDLVFFHGLTNFEISFFGGEFPQVFLQLVLRPSQMQQGIPQASDLCGTVNN